MRAGRGAPRTAQVTAAYAAVWLLLTAVVATALFFASSRTVSLASHDAVVRPDLSGSVVVRTGPILPDLRVDSGSRVGVEVQLGKTDATSPEALVARYAVIASQPDGQVSAVRTALGDMASDAVFRGGLIAALPLLLWALVGPHRRRELARRARGRDGVLAALLVLVLVSGIWAPWDDDGEEPSTADWFPLADLLGPGVPLPEEMRDIEVRGDVTTRQTRRLVESAVDTYRKSRGFYARAAEAAAALPVRRPADGEVVVVLVSDRHDNIGMDAVARAIGDAAGATGVLDAGDDTSTGRSWEAFSLDSLDAAFDDETYGDRRWAVAGNHDHGGFVPGYLADHGWTVLDGEVVEGPDGGRLLGVGDPRSSGLGSWRDETGLSFEEVGSRLADAACAAAEEDGARVATVLVHDVDLAEEALRRGCVDLAVGGHLHVQVGPERVVADDGSTAWRHTTGTTGGAAYAIAVGSKIRRNAQVSLVTYRDGRPVGVQGVTLRTDGRFRVGRWVPLRLDD